MIFLGTPAGGFGDGYFTELFTIYGVDILILIVKGFALKTHEGLCPSTLRAFEKA